MAHDRLRDTVLAATLLAVACSRTDANISKPEPAVAVQKAAISESPVAASAQPARAALDPRTRGWDIGKAYRYRLKLASNIAFGSQTAFDFELEGAIAIVPASQNAESTTLYAMIRDVRIESRVPKTQTDFDKIAAELAAGAFFVTLAGGRVTEMRVPPGSSALSANIYREIGSRLQFARPAAAADHYETEEYDATGAYTAEYRRSDTEPSSWRKKKLAYLRILTAHAEATANIPLRVVPQVVQSEGEVRLSADGRPEVLHVRDEILLNGAQAPVRAKNALSLEAPEVGQPGTPAPDFAALIAKTQRFAADEPYSRQSAVASLDGARIGGLSFDVIVKRLEGIQKSESSPSASNDGKPLDDDARAKKEQAVARDAQLFSALAATFRKNPETVARAVQRIGSSPVAYTLVDALGSSGSAAAHRALADLANPKKTSDSKLRLRATYALARTPTPTDVSIDALKGVLVADPYDATALYGLGTHVARLRDAGQLDRARSVGNFLIEKLKGARDMTQQVTTLGAIANSGNDAALPHVAPLLTDEREPVRVAAIRSLQSMQEPGVDQRIADRIGTDPSSQVVLSAIAAARARQPNDLLTRALTTAAVKASDPHVRYGALDLLVEWLPKRPDLRAIIARVSTTDAESRVRDRAKAAL